LHDVPPYGGIIILKWLDIPVLPFYYILKLLSKPETSLLPALRINVYGV